MVGVSHAQCPGRAQESREMGKGVSVGGLVTGVALAGRVTDICGVTLSRAGPERHGTHGVKHFLHQGRTCGVRFGI